LYSPPDICLRSLPWTSVQNPLYFVEGKVAFLNFPIIDEYAVEDAANVSVLGPSCKTRDEKRYRCGQDGSFAPRKDARRARTKVDERSPPISRFGKNFGEAADGAKREFCRIRIRFVRRVPVGRDWAELQDVGR